MSTLTTGADDRISLNFNASASLSGVAISRDALANSS
jgi:hypothetical protein